MASLTTAEGNWAKASQEAGSIRETGRLVRLETARRERAERAYERDQLRALEANQNVRRATSPKPAVLVASPLPRGDAVHWPLVLTSDEFQGERRRVDELWPMAVEPGTHKALTDAVASLRQKLRARVNELRGGDYAGARAFLDDLERGFGSAEKGQAGRPEEAVLAARKGS